MSISNVVRRGLSARIASLFPERELFVCTRGQVRFISVSAKLQMWCAGMALLVVSLWAVTGAWAMAAHAEIARERFAVDTAQRRSASQAMARQAAIDARAKRIERRQRELDALVRSYFGEVAAAEQAESVAVTGDADTLARAEQHQSAFTEKLAVAVAERTETTRRAIRGYGLDPDQLVGRERRGMGGPLFAVPQDTRFERLARSLRRLDRFEQALVAIPNAAPAAPMTLSSGYGFRFDPLTGDGALHAGIDVTGAHGQKISAAAAGRVVHVGPSGGYGNLVTIDHGQGIETRYGHLSGFTVQTGDRVARGSPIARMGNTGRSTGTHLHFEVRIHGRPIDPRPFIGRNAAALEVRNTVERRFARR